MRRYESYKDSGMEWLRQIPSHWDVQRSKFIFKKIERKVNEEDQIVTCFRDGQVTLRANRRTEGFTNALKEHGYQGIRKGDLVIHAMDAFAGAIGISDSDGKATPVYSVCLPHDKQKIDVYFYAYYLRNLALSGFISSLAKGIRERSTDFRYADFAELLLPIPPYLEQQKIAQFLDNKTAKIDQAVDLAEKQIALLKEHKQILIQNAVTRGLNPDMPLKDSGVEWIGQVPEHWEVKKIKHVTSKIGSGITPLGGGSNYIDGGIPLLRSQNIHFDRIDLNDVARISEFTHNSMKNSKVRKGDVLLNITGGSLGRCFYVDSNEEMNVNQHVCIIRPNKKINTIFLNMLLASEIGQKQIWFFQQGGGREGLNFQAIKNFYLPLPDLEEQQKIAIYLNKQATKIDQAIALKTAHIEKLKEYKSVLINDVVTGKVRVSV